jgi:hypothetical protein
VVLKNKLELILFKQKERNSFMRSFRVLIHSHHSALGALGVNQALTKRCFSHHPQHITTTTTTKMSRLHLSAL